MTSFTAAPSSCDAKVNWSEAVLDPRKQGDDGKPEFTSKERVEFYSKNAEHYDQDMEKYSYRGPEVTAQVAHSLLKDNQDAYILDIGCGTGRVVEEMNKLGSYRNVDGLEPAEGMIELAKRKGLYKKYLQQFFHLNSGILQNTYDAAVSSGTFVAGHMKSDCMEELCNIVKPGGFVIVVMRREHMDTVEEYKKNLRATISRLVDEGRWSVVEDRTFPGWTYAKDGQGIEGQIFAYQKTK